MSAGLRSALSCDCTVLRLLWYVLHGVASRQLGRCMTVLVVTASLWLRVQTVDLRAAGRAVRWTVAQSTPQWQTHEIKGGSW